MTSDKPSPMTSTTRAAAPTDRPPPMRRRAHSDAPPKDVEPLMPAFGDVVDGKYRVEERIGIGGMGVVVAARHLQLKQKVALKFLLPEGLRKKGVKERFMREARAAVAIASEHIARVIDVGALPSGIPFIVMEHLEGTDLSRLLDDRGAFTPEEAAGYVLEACEAIAEAHALGIVHRDLKPSNLFLTHKPDGTQIIKILDFGIAKSGENDETPERHSLHLTGGRAVLGSPPYMSPEQVRAPKTVDHRTDIWSIGICMYELLTNSMPFGGDELQETFAQILEKQPTPIRDLVTGVPEGLAKVVTKCLSKKREDRYADVGELARALVPFGSGTWMQSADRVAATLARGAMGAMEDASGPRLRPPPSSQRLEIPSAPRRDSMQPELTANARAKDGSGNKKLVIGVVATFSVVGIALIAGTTLADRSAARIDEATAASAAKSAAAASASDVAPSTEVAAPTPGPATTLVTAPVATAGPENEIAGGPQGTVVGAGASPGKKPGAPPAKLPAVPAKKPGAPGKPALPAGLPRERQ